MFKVGRALRADSLANFSRILAGAEISVRSLSRNFAAIFELLLPYAVTGPMSYDEDEIKKRRLYFSSSRMSRFIHGINT